MKGKVSWSIGRRPVWTLILLLSLYLFFMLCCAPFTGELLVYQISPPVYPDSRLVGQYYSGGPDSMWRERTYHTDDDIDTVLSYYERHMAGFQEDDRPVYVGLGNIQYAERQTPAYMNHKCNKGITAHYLSYFFDGIFPCVSVEISGLPAGGAAISFYQDWPAP